MKPEAAQTEDSAFRAKSRRKRSALNAVLSLIGEFTIVVVGIFVPKAIIFNFNSETNGLVTSMQQIIGYLTLFESGIYGAAMVALFKPMAEHDLPKINKICTAAANYYRKIGLLYIVFVVGLAFIYPLTANQGTYSYGEIVGLVLVVSLNCIVQIFSGSRYKVALMSSQKNGLMSVIRCFSMSLYYALIILLSYLHLNIILVYGLASLAFVVRSLLFAFACHKTMPGISFYVKGAKFKFDKSFDVLLQQILSMIVLNSTVLIMLFANTSMSIVSVFTVYNMVLSSLYLVMDAINNSVLTSFGNLMVEKRERAISIYREFDIVFQELWSILIPCLAVLLIPFVRVYTAGADIDYVDFWVAIACIATCGAWMIRCQQTIILSSEGEFKQMRWGAIVEAVLVVGFSIGGYFLWGLAGLLFGKLIGVLYRMIELVIVNNLKKNMDSLRFTIKEILVSLLSSTLSILLLLSIFNFLNLSSSLLHWILQALIAVLVSGVVTLTIRFFFDYSSLTSTFKKGLSFFRKKRSGNQTSKTNVTTSNVPLSFTGKVLRISNGVLLFFRQHSKIIAACSYGLFVVSVIVSVATNVLYFGLVGFALLIIISFMLPRPFRLGITLFALAFANVLKFRDGGASFYLLAFLPGIIDFFLLLKRVHPQPGIFVVLSATAFAIYLLLVPQFTGDSTVLIAFSTFFLPALFLFSYLLLLKQAGLLEQCLPFYCLMGLSGLLVSSLSILPAYFFKDFSSNFETIVGEPTRIISGWRRFGALFADPNLFGFCVLCFVSISSIVKKQGIMRYAGFFLGSLLYLIGFLSISYTYAICAVFLGVVYLVFFFLSFKTESNEAKRIFSITLGITFLILCGGAIGLSTVFIQKAGSLPSWDDVFSGRLEIWGSYFSFFGSNPLTIVFGNGVGSLRGDALNGKMGHNLLIDWIYDFGIVGSLLNLGMVGAFTASFMKGKALKRQLIFGLLLWFDLILFSMTTELYSSLFFLILMPIFLAAGSTYGFSGQASKPVKDNSDSSLELQI
jgi:hypothetical protein